MRDPVLILGHLANKGPDYRYHRLYRLLYNPAWYHLAWQRLAPQHPSLATLSLVERNERITALIQQLRDRSYRPHKMLWEPLPSAKLRGKHRRHRRRSPYLVPVLRWEDLLLQEVVRSLLTACYEPHFLRTSHAFRGQRGCHTALAQAQATLGDTAWILSSTSPRFPDLDGGTLLRLLGERIEDTLFLQLIGRLLKAGYLNSWQYPTAGYHNTPRGSILGPLLTNIYFHALDQWAERFKKHFLHQEKRLSYTRHGEEWVLGLAGSRLDALYVQEKMAKFLEQTLLLPPAPIALVHSSKKVRFLGYDLYITRQPQRASAPCRLSLPHEMWTKRLFALEAVRVHPRTHLWKAKHRPYLVAQEDERILAAYNAEIERTYQYYRLAHNVRNLQRFNYIMRLSFYKTLASKYKSTVRQMARKYSIEGKLGIQTEQGIEWFYQGGFRQHRLPREQAIAGIQPD